MNRYYTTFSHNEFVDEEDNFRIKTDNDKVFAKAVQSGLTRDVTQRNPSYYKYYVRTYPNKKLYDPVPLYSVSDNKTSFIDKICKSENIYKEVTESVFNMYLMYLKTESPQWYNKAQRELSNLP
jgi:hypothetical protein